MSTNSKIITNMKIIVSGRNSEVLYFDSESGHIYHICLQKDGRRLLQCAAHLLSLPTKSVLDDRPQAGSRKETYKQALALAKNGTSLLILFQTCSAVQNIEQHNHDPPHRLFYEWSLFRWVCQLTAIVHHQRGCHDPEAVIKEVFTSWPRVLSLNQANVVKFLKHSVGQTLEHLKFEQIPSYLQIFMKVHTLEVAAPFFCHMDTSQPYWSEPEFCILPSAKEIFKLTNSNGEKDDQNRVEKRMDEKEEFQEQSDLHSCLHEKRKTNRQEVEKSEIALLSHLPMMESSTISIIDLNEQEAKNDISVPPTAKKQRHHSDSSSFPIKK